MFQYSIDHNGAYPDGKTSTEVFQKLIDEKYALNASIFYLDMPGKTKSTSTTLLPENVCFDVTSGVTSNSPDGLPLVFSTGYTITYQPGGSATPLPSGHPSAGFAVSYKSNAARAVNPGSDGTVPNVVPDYFDPGTKTYTQLTP